MVRNKLIAGKFLVIFCLCVILAVGFSTLSLTEGLMSNQDFAIKLSTIAKLQWDELPEVDVVKVQPPSGGSFLELPGSKSRPVRPYLEPFVNSHGVAARLLRGDGQVIPVAVVVNETPSILELPQPPLALSMRQDGGIWILNRGELVYSDISGKPIQTLPLSGITLVSGQGNAVWVIGLDNTWFITGEGNILGPYPWKAGFGSASSGNYLCRLDKKEPRKVHCLDKEGQQRLFTLSSSPQPFEQLLAFDEDRAVTKTASQLRLYDSDGVIAELVVQAAGLTVAGDAFISGSQESQIALFINQKEKFLRLPSSVNTLSAYPVVAVADKRFLVYGLDQGIWYSGEQVERIFGVNEENYRQDIFPYLWQLGSHNFAAANSEGTVVLSASGPTGVVLISLQLES